MTAIWHRIVPGDDLTGRTRRCRRIENWEAGERH